MSQVSVPRSVHVLCFVLLAALLSAMPAIASTSSDAETPPPNLTAPIPEPPVGLAPPGYGPWQEACPTGGDQCIEVVIREMVRHREDLGCDHNAVFALLYHRTTEGIRDHIGDGHFLDASLLNRQATVFARYYLDAYYAWDRDHDTRVPEAWRIAFDAAADHEVHSLGNMYLGINAHVNRDLPFVLYRLGLIRDDEHADDRFADHNAVNVVLGRTRGVAFPEIGLTLDPTIFEVGHLLPAMAPDAPELADGELVPNWRQHAWEQAERLYDAEDEAARAEVAADIEEDAAEKAERILAATSYGGDWVDRLEDDFDGYDFAGIRAGSCSIS